MFDSQNILANINQRIQSGKQLLPGFPDIAIRVRRAVEKDLAMSEIAKIIQSDIPLTTRLVQVANSPLYRGVVPVEHCEGAVSRLGMEVTRNLVTSFALRRLLMEKHAKTRKQLEKLWRHSIKVAAVSFILARITPGFDPSRAMLAGLIHDIGVLPLYTYAEENSDILKDEKEFQKICQELRITLGERLLKSWNLDEELIRVIRESENWNRDKTSRPDYVDVVMISQLHATLSEIDRPTNWPKPHETPAYKKFHVFNLGPGAAAELMTEAQDEIDELQSLLRV